MHPDVQALLRVQDRDEEILGLEARLKELEPRLVELERARSGAEASLERARRAAESEEQRQRELQGRVQQHRHLAERNEAQIEGITNQREALAAMSQLDQSRRMVLQAEGEAQATAQRAHELREAAERQADALAELTRSEAELRESLGAERQAIQTELATVRAQRAEVARAVPRQILSKYDRILARRRSRSVFPLRGPSCSNCDTAVPTQRRSVMATTGVLEMCEACGVLLYAGE